MSNRFEQSPDLSPEKKRALLERILREKAAQAKSVPLSFAQQRLWFLDKLEPNSATYNVPTVLKLEGEIDRDALQRSLDAILARHEALRTTFPAQDGAPSERVEKPRQVELAFIDLSRLDDATREKEAERLMIEEARRPFDLAEDLMVRGTLIHTGSEEHLLVLVAHHIASDEWSLRVLFREWGELYSAFRQGRAPNLPDLSIQYSDFAQWQREWVQSAEFKRQMEYWGGKLKAPLPVLQLPTDHTRPSTQTYKGALFTSEIPSELAARVREFGERENASLFMTLLAVFKVVIFRYTRQEDIIVGSPIAGRNRLELEPLIGFFVNMLPLRSSLSGDTTFREFLQSMRETTLGAYANQDVPFDKLVEELHPERSSTHMPLVQVVFSLDHDFVEENPFPGIHSKMVEVDTGTSKFELTFVATDTPQGIRVAIEYNTDLFERARIQGFFGHFISALASVIEQPSQKISEVSLLTPREEERIVRGWNETGTDYPRNDCIHRLFEAQVAKTPEAIALEYGEEKITYRELNARANQLAHRLGKLNAGPKTLVGVYMDRGIEMIVAFLGILKAGAAYVPLDLSYPKERLGFMIEDAAMPVLLTQTSLIAELPNSAATMVCLDSDWESISQEPRQLPPNRVAATDLAYIIYTSGSTGKPKGVAVPHRGVTRLVLNTNYIQIKPLERIAQASNASFDAATFEIWGALLNGGCVVGVSKETSLSPLDFAETLQNKRVQTLFLTTALFNQLAREVPGVFGTLDNVLFGGEAVDPKWVRAVLECEPPKRLLHVYGPTESTTFTSWHPIESVSEEASTVPIGKPISNTEIYILDENQRPVPPGIPGELYVGGDGLADGYWRRPELTAEKFVANPFKAEERLYRTGDLARFDAEGNVEFIGRIDHQVKIRGLRIELGEIESLLARHPAVNNVIVLAREDIPGDRRLVAYLVPKGDAPKAGDLRAWLSAELPEYMVPSAFVVMKSFPLTPNEKVDRKALPPPEQNRPDLGKTFIAPRNETEAKLAKIWEKILGVQPIGMADNFFELGGHSLLAVRLFSQIETVFERKLPLATLFRAPTIGEMAKLLCGEDHAESWNTLVEIQPNGSQPPFFWIHSLGGDGGGGFFYYRKLAELLGQDQPSYGVRSPRKPFDRIEEMAAFYIEEIRKFQPQGPYSLGGFCFGGIVAYEVARQLTDQGERVGVLALMESSAPNVHPENQWNTSAAMHSIENLVENVKDFVTHSPREQIAYVRRKGQALKRKLAGKFGPASGEQEPKVELKDVLDLTNYPKDYVKYAETHWQALTRFHPKPYSGALHLFRARKQGLSHFSHTLGWESLVGDRVHVTVIPGTHENMLQEPNVQILANKLRGLLQESAMASEEELAAIEG